MEQNYVSVTLRIRIVCWASETIYETSNDATIADSNERSTLNEREQRRAS